MFGVENAATLGSVWIKASPLRDSSASLRSVSLPKAGARIEERSNFRSPSTLSDAEDPLSELMIVSLFRNGVGA